MLKMKAQGGIILRYEEYNQGVSQINSQITDHVINWIEQDAFENLSLELISWNYPQRSNSDCSNDLWILGTLKDPANDASYLPRLMITYDEIYKEERSRRSRGNGSLLSSLLSNRF